MIPEDYASSFQAVVKRTEELTGQARRLEAYERMGIIRDHRTGQFRTQQSRLGKPSPSVPVPVENLPKPVIMKARWEPPTPIPPPEPTVSDIMNEVHGEIAAAKMDMAFQIDKAAESLQRKLEASVIESATVAQVQAVMDEPDELDEINYPFQVGIFALDTDKLGIRDGLWTWYDEDNVKYEAFLVSDGSLEDYSEVANAVAASGQVWLKLVTAGNTLTAHFYATGGAPSINAGELWLKVAECEFAGGKIINVRNLVFGNIGPTWIGGMSYGYDGVSINIHVDGVSGQNQLQIYEFDDRANDEAAITDYDHIGFGQNATDIWRWITWANLRQTVTDVVYSYYYGYGYQTPANVPHTDLDFSGNSTPGTGNGKSGTNADHDDCYWHTYAHSDYIDGKDFRTTGTVAAATLAINGDEASNYWTENNLVAEVNTLVQLGSNDIKLGVMNDLSIGLPSGPWTAGATITDGVSLNNLVQNGIVVNLDAWTIQSAWVQTDAAGTMVEKKVLMSPP